MYPSGRGQTPGDGRDAVFISETFTNGIVGMTAREGLEMTRLIQNHVTQSQFRVQVAYEPHQLAMWDNRSLIHRGLQDDASAKRVIQRASVSMAAPPVATRLLWPRRRRGGDVYSYPHRNAIDARDPRPGPSLRFGLTPHLFHGLLRLLELRHHGVLAARGHGSTARLPAHLRADQPSEDGANPGGLERRLDERGDPGSGRLREFPQVWCSR